MDEAERSEFERASMGYLVWPSSLLALAREPPAASTWSRIHTRQAVVYGAAVSLGYLLLMAVPLLIVIAAPAISTATTVAVYAGGILADVIAFVVLVVLTVVYSSRASRGELFSIPLVSAFADRAFRLRR
jgi:uncharacterized membrane protein